MGFVLRGLPGQTYPSMLTKQLFNNSFSSLWSVGILVEFVSQSEAQLNETRFVRALRALPRVPEGFYNKILRN